MEIRVYNKFINQGLELYGKRVKRKYINFVLHLWLQQYNKSSIKVSSIVNSVIVDNNAYRNKKIILLALDQLYKYGILGNHVDNGMLDVYVRNIRDEYTVLDSDVFNIDLNIYDLALYIILLCKMNKLREVEISMDDLCNITCMSRNGIKAALKRLHSKAYVYYNKDVYIVVDYHYALRTRRNIGSQQLRIRNMDTLGKLW